MWNKDDTLFGFIMRLLLRLLRRCIVFIIQFRVDSISSYTFQIERTLYDIHLYSTFVIMIKYETTSFLTSFCFANSDGAYLCNFNTGRIFHYLFIQRTFQKIFKRKKYLKSDDTKVRKLKKTNTLSNLRPERIGLICQRPA